MAAKSVKTRAPMETNCGDLERSPREQLFGPDAPPVPVLYDQADIKKSIYTGRWETPQPHFGDHRLEHVLHLRCLQGWFYRSSWSDKFSFILELCELTTGTLVLEQILKCIDLVHTKDVVDSFARDRIRFAYDVVPTDDSRALSFPDLEMAKQEDAVWFVGLEATAQVEVLVKLLKLGGGGLIFRAYGEIDRLYKQRREIETVLTAVGHAIRELGEGDRVMTSTSMRTNQSMASETPQGSRDEYTAKRLEQVTRRNSELNEFRKRYGLADVPISKGGNGKNGNAKRKEPPETMDHVQVLPLWVNRKIVLYLKEKEISEVKKVGKYWTKMVEEAVRESCGRANMNARIGKIAGGTSADRTDGETDEVWFRHIPTAGREALLSDLHLRKGDLICAEKETEKFRRRKFEARSWEDMSFGSVCCAVNETCKLLAASTPNKVIQFFYLRTGARTGNLVTGFQSPVTSLTVHDEGFHVIVGFESGALICFDIRKNEKVMSYKGHSGAVLMVHVTDDKLVSASEDRTVKYFDLWSGLCLLCSSVEAALTSVIVFLEGNEPEFVCAGTLEGKVIVINLRKKKIYEGIQVHDKQVNAMTHQGDLLVTAGGDRAIRLWNMRCIRGQSDSVKPYWGNRLSAPATGLFKFQTQVYAACADGRLSVMCLLTGEIVREIEVTQRRPITGVHVVAEPGVTRIIVWHEKGIEERSFSTTGREKAKHVKTSRDRAREKATLARRRLFSLLPSEAIHSALPQPKNLKHFKPVTQDDREKVLIDRSCTVDRIRKSYGASCVVIRQDVFTQMVSKFDLWPMKDHEITTFPRLKRRDFSTNMFNISETTLD